MRFSAAVPIDDGHRGRSPALWLFSVLVLVRAGQSLGSILDGRDAAIRADALPLETFTSAGAQAVVTLIAVRELASSCSACRACLDPPLAPAARGDDRRRPSPAAGVRLSSI